MIVSLCVVVTASVLLWIILISYLSKKPPDIAECFSSCEKQQVLLRRLTWLSFSNQLSKGLLLQLSRCYINSPSFNIFLELLLFNSNVGGFFRGWFWDRFEVEEGGGGENTLPHVKLVRITLETSNLAHKYTHMYLV